MTTMTTPEYQDEWRDEMLAELLQLIGWYKIALPTKENFEACLKSYKEKHNEQN